MRCCLALLVLVLVLVALLLLLNSLASSLPFPLLVRSVHWIGSVGFCALVLWVVHGPGSHGVPVVAWRGMKFCRPSRPWCGDGAAIRLHPGNSWGGTSTRIQFGRVGRCLEPLVSDDSVLRGSQFFRLIVFHFSWEKRRSISLLQGLGCQKIWQNATVVVFIVI